jgi:hypothetical protein
LSSNKVRSVHDLRRAASSPVFQNELKRLWEEILRAEGGKLTLTLVMSVVGIALGGVGIAAGGGAFGLPLLALLAPAGFFAGQELDTEHYGVALWGKLGKFVTKVKGKKPGQP